MTPADVYWIMLFAGILLGALAWSYLSVYILHPRRHRAKAPRPRRTRPRNSFFDDEW